MRASLLLCAIAALTCACGGATPRFSPDIAASLAETPMRRLETERMHLYYPAARREQALRVAARLEGCAAAIAERAPIASSYTRARMVVVMPDFPFNNAFVSGPAAGQDPYSVIPTFNTFDFTTELGLPGDPSYIGCHEIVHYVHLLQIDGTWRWLNTIFGDLLSPHVGLEPWFIEGLATYYESRLQPGTGRMAWPAWRGMFHAGVAEHDIRGGDLSAFARASQWGNHYHVGSFFIEFLVERHGEDRLWRLIGAQGRSLAFPLWVSLRFKAVYGKTLSALIDEFALWAAQRFPPRARPPSQRRLRALGLNARYARAGDGTEAVIARDHDAPPRLLLYRPDGALWREHHLVDVVPPRMLISAAPEVVSGLSFTGDGRTLYFTAVDAGTTADIVRLVEYDVDSGAMRVAHHGLGGLGGAVAPDGSRYYFARARGDRMDLAVLDLGTGQTRTLARAAPQTYILAPRPSPDGTQLVASVFDPARGFQLRLYDAASGAPAGAIDLDGRRAYDASFSSPGRLVFVAEHEGRFQVFAHDLATATTTRLSDAPYLALTPRAQGDTVRFLNREGWGWTLDEIALPPPLAPAPPIAPPAPSPPPALPDTGASAGQPVPGPLPPPVSAQPRVLSDEPYSQLDHLFVPQARALAAITLEGGALLGLTLSGADRLSFHNWSVTGLYQPGARRASGADGLSGSVAYVNTQLAPFLLGASASQRSWEASLEDEAGDERTEARLQRDAEVFISRTLRGSTRVQLSGVATEDRRPDDPDPSLRRRRLAGPSLAMDYAGVEATGYGGLRRALLASARAAFYPEAWSSLDRSFADLRGELGITLPLPLSRRHALDLTLRGRQLAGAAGSDLLQVGGLGLFAPLYQRAEGADPPEDDPAPLLPPSIQLYELLRGFEDYPLYLDRVAIADLVYRYPIIIDRGFASTLYLFPSLFFRQLDVELFASAGLDRIHDLDQRLHAAAGGAVSLGFSIWVMPLSLRYQLAQRLTDDQALVHDIGLGLGF